MSGSNALQVDHQPVFIRLEYLFFCVSECVLPVIVSCQCCLASDMTLHDLALQSWFSNINTHTHIHTHIHVYSPNRTINMHIQTNSKHTATQTFILNQA